MIFFNFYKFKDKIINKVHQLCILIKFIINKKDVFKIINK